MSGSWFEKYSGRNDEDVYVVDILCHGVPSNKMLQDYIRESQEKEVQSVEFRSKEKDGEKALLICFKPERWR